MLTKLEFFFVLQEGNRGVRLVNMSFSNSPTLRSRLAKIRFLEKIGGKKEAKLIW